MADSFQQRISLEGAEDIIRNLQQIGTEATKAIGQLKQAVTSANPALAALSTTTATAQNAMKGFGEAVRGATTVIAPFSGAVGGLLTTFGAFAGPAGILAAVGGLGLFVKNAADSAIAIDRQSRALGLSIEQFKALKTVVAQSGLSADELVNGLTRISSKVAEIAADQQKAAGDIAKLINEGLLKGFRPTPTSIINVDQVKADIAKLKAAIAEAVPIIQEQLRQAGITRFDTSNTDEFARKLFDAAKGGDAASKALRDLIRDATNLSTAVTPADKLAEALEKQSGSIKSLGASFLDAKGNVLGLFDSTLKLSEALSKLPEGPTRAAAAIKLAGRGIGPELFQALINGRGEAEKLVAELKKIGIDTSAIEAARALNKQMLELEKNARAAQQSLLLTIGPTITTELEKLNADIKKITSPQTILFSIDTPLAPLGGFNLTIDEIKRSFQQLKDFFSKDTGQVLDPIKAEWANLPQFLKDQFSSVDFSGIWQQFKTGFNDLVQAIKGENWSDVFTGLVSSFNTAVNDINNLWQRVLDKIREASAAAAEAVPDISEAGGIGTGGGFARGGMIWGPGSGTSDSILARLSRGEFVIKAAAVSHYGPQLLAAINAMRLPRLPGFALGGLAEGLGRTLRANLAIPGLAVGGAIPAPARAAAVPITLDLRTDRGHFRGSAMADRDVAEALSRFAVIDQITSVGRKSGAY